jgi:hypothetical protein
MSRHLAEPAERDRAEEARNQRRARRLSRLLNTSAQRWIRLTLPADWDLHHATRARVE